MLMTGCDATRHEQVIRKLYVYLTSHILPDELLDHLFAASVIDYSEMEAIRSQKFPTKRERCGQLLNIVQRKSSQQFDMFVDSLVQTNQQHVAQLILGLIALNDCPYRNNARVLTLTR